MIDCCTQCGKDVHVVIGDASGDASKDISALLGGNALIVKLACFEDYGYVNFGHWMFGFGMCTGDFIRKSRGSWSYIYDTRIDAIPENLWGMMDSWLQMFVSTVTDDVVDSMKCPYYDVMMVNGLNARSSLNGADFRQSR